MMFFFRPHVCYVVLGYYKITGFQTMGERFLEAFEKKGDAETFAAKIRAKGDHEKRYYSRVDIRKVNITDKFDP